MAAAKRKAATKRAKPGARGGGQFFHIEVRPRRQFKTFRTQDVGRKGGIERVAGRCGSGSLALGALPTQAMRRARSLDIKKAQAARRKTTK
jgi:hypothetical protein